MVQYGRQAYIEVVGVLWSYVRGATFICSDRSKEGLLTKNICRKTARKYVVMLVTVLKSED